MTAAPKVHRLDSVRPGRTSCGLLAPPHSAVPGKDCVTCGNCNPWLRGPQLDAMLSAIATAVLSARYRFRDETQLQQSIGQVLAGAGFDVTPEAILTAADRIDFLIGRVGIEVKIASAPDRVRRQLARYAASPDLDALLLVTTKASHRALAGQIGGKPVRVAWISGVTG